MINSIRGLTWKGSFKTLFLVKQSLVQKNHETTMKTVICRLKTIAIQISKSSKISNSLSYQLSRSITNNIVIEKCAIRTQIFNSVQWKWVERPQIDLCIYRNLVYDGSGNIKINGKGYRFNTWFWDNYIFKIGIKFRSFYHIQKNPKSKNLAILT